MSDREILLRWLATAAVRFDLDSAHARARPICLRARRAVSARRSARDPWRSRACPFRARSPAAIVALAVVALLAWRLARPTTLAQAAGAADTRAALKDELKSAHWFVQRAARGAFVELMVTRAAQTAQRLELAG